MKIKRPTLIIDEQKARQNIESMVAKASKSGAWLRPHFKTHHSATVGNWFRDYGVNKITVSSVSMATYFAKHGWHDITIAFPYNPLEYNEINELAAKYTVNLLISSREAFQHLSAHVIQPVSYYIKIDVGYHRTGLELSDVDEILFLANTREGFHSFAGILAHAGHSYHCRSQEELCAIYETSSQNLDLVKSAIDKDMIVSYGDTPTCSAVDTFSGIDEIRCGNFVYYDLMQHQISACGLDQIAVAVACPVVALHPARNQAIVYGGGVHFSKDRLVEGDEVMFGMGVAFRENQPWELLPDVKIASLSQEHGVVQFKRGIPKSLKIGDVLGFLPVHSCMAADLLSDQQTLKGIPVTKMPK